MGGFWAGQLVGIATVMQDALPDNQDPQMWRLKAVATLPEFRGRGIGKWVIDWCIDYVCMQGGLKLWCYARPEAVGFYLRLGFHMDGDLQAGIGHGPRYFMWRELRG